MSLRQDPTTSADRPAAILDHWIALAPFGRRRLFGFLGGAERLYGGNWILSRGLVEFDPVRHFARADTGVVYKLEGEMTDWPSEARAAVRSFAETEAWPPDAVPAPARLRLGEDLGGIPDDFWVTVVQLARFKYLQCPDRNLAAVHEFMREHHEPYLQIREFQALLSRRANAREQEDRGGRSAETDGGEDL